MYMDDMKLFAKKKRKIGDSDANNRYILYIRMKFDIDKRATFIMISVKREITERIELPNQERIRTLREKENDKNLGILEADSIKQAEIKGKNKKKLLQKDAKDFKNQTLSHECDKHFDSPPPIRPPP